MDFEIDFYTMDEIPCTKSLVLDPKINAWVLEPNLVNLATVLANPAFTIAYLQKQYSLIFPDYVPSEHYVIENMVGNALYLSLVKKSATPPASLPPGLYRLEGTNAYGWVLKPFTVALDTWVTLGDQADILTADLVNFFANGAIYAANGLRHRRSALLYGAPGQGKTRAILEALRCQPGLVTIFVETAINPSYLGDYQLALGTTPTVFVFEEITNYVGEKLPALLTFLDGQDSWCNTYTIATTNYPDSLADNIVDRPGRFETLLEFEAPTEAARTLYLTHFGLTVTKELLQATKDLSIDYLRYVVLQNKCFGLDPVVAIQKIKANRVKVSRSFKGGLGFG